MNDRQLKILLLVACVALLLWRQGGVSPANPPPFKTDKLAVLVVEESSNGDTPVWVRGTSAKSVKAAVEKAGGSYRVLDLDDPTDKLDPPWPDAMAAAKGKTLPWIVAADKATGFSKSVTTQADAMEALKPLGVK